VADCLSNDDLSTVLAIIGVGIPIGLTTLFQLRNELKNQTNELRSQTSKFVQTETELANMNNFLKKITQSQIHEKIAILNECPTQTL
jgi:hypothetical protein